MVKVNLELMRRVYSDPWAFAKVAFNWEGLKDATGRAVTEPTVQQSQLLGGIAWELGQPGPKLHYSIRSGHGTGKSAALAQLAIWFLLMRPNGLIPCTAPSAHQLEDVLWKEIARWESRLLPPFKGLLEITTDRVRFKHRKDGLGEAIARTARKENPDALQGFHAAQIMYLIDEAPGVPEAIFQTAEGALTTPGAISVMAGNPTRVSGTFYRSHHEDRADWNCLHWSSVDSPLVAPEYAGRMARKYGRESFIYKVRVEGEFPTGNPDALISLDVAQSAVERELPEDVWKKEPVVFGVDPARFGDDETGFCVRQGRKVHEIKGWGGLDTMQVSGRVVYEAKKWKPGFIFVDSIGIGSGVADYLRMALGKDSMVVDVNVSERPANVDEYANFRSEMWWKGKEWFDSRGVQVPDDDTLVSELTTTNWKPDEKGRIRIETKAERKRRLGADQGGSPDRADALMMTFCMDAPAETHQAASRLVPAFYEDF